MTASHKSRQFNHRDPLSAAHLACIERHLIGNLVTEMLGMARVVKGLHSFSCTSTHPSILVFTFPAEAGPRVLIREGWKAELAY